MDFDLLHLGINQAKGNFFSKGFGEFSSIF